MAPCQHDTMSKTTSCQKQCRVNTTPCQDGAVPRRCRDKYDVVSTRCRFKTVPRQDDDKSIRSCVNTVSCQHVVVSCRVKTTPCQNKAHQNNVVSSRRDVNTMPCQCDVVTTGWCEKITPCQDGIVPQQRCDSTTYCQQDVVSERRRI